MELAKGCAPSSASTISTQLSGASLLCLLKTPKAMILVKPATVIQAGTEALEVEEPNHAKSGVDLGWRS